MTDDQLLFTTFWSVITRFRETAPDVRLAFARCVLRPLRKRLRKTPTWGDSDTHRVLVDVHKFYVQHPEEDMTGVVSEVKSVVSDMDLPAKTRISFVSALLTILG